MYQWLWDALRQDYYYFSQERNAYIYQSGGIVPRVTNQNVGTTETQEYELFVLHMWNKGLS
jgi:hypothetical protein